MEINTVTILMKEYIELKSCEAIVDALYKHGVDNWEWHDDAIASIECKDVD